AGGVNLYLHPSGYIGLCAQQMLSPDGQCRSFGAGGNGFVPGEGVGGVLLKPLYAAIRDQDVIHAVIRATKVNHGGKTNGYTVPNPRAQAELIRSTLDKAGISARKISYIEAHGTGTELGDPIEIAGLSQAFQKDTKEVGFCRIGSAKSNIGHLEAAAGIAGLTKIILQMKYGQIVPSLHSRTLNQNIAFEKTPFMVNQELVPWRRPVIEGREVPRLAGISSFGAGGANAHVVLEEYCTKDSKTHSSIEIQTKDPVIIPLSARTNEQLKERARDLFQFLRSSSIVDLQSIAYTLQAGREAMEVRLGFIVTSAQVLEEKLEVYLSGEQEIEECYQGEVKRNKEMLGVFTADEDL
ncbi:MAG: polyketide synthase, partial [Planctomycetes bacterium]|nr:polyketide synthase [Planctomycetota bacterium]